MGAIAMLTIALFGTSVVFMVPKTPTSLNDALA